MNKKVLATLLICVSTVLCVVLFCFAPQIKSALQHAISVSDDMIIKSRQYQTTDLADYGNYIGNYDNRSVREFINSFFPDSIQDEFSDVTYSYRAKKLDSYAFEAYLEFTIEDPQAYQRFVETHTKNLESSVFRYDEEFVEYTISDYLFTWIDDQDPSIIHFEAARIGNFLCSDRDQKIIFFALGVHDGGAAATDYLNFFFNRFQIDPKEYVDNYNSAQNSSAK